MDKEKFDYKGQGDLTFDYDKWNDYLNAQYGELCERYQGKIKGMFLDEGLANPANNLSVDYPRLRDTIKSIDPSLVMMQNEYNGKYSCDTSMWELPTAWHGGSYNNLNSWQTNTIPIGTSLGNISQGYSWWAQKTRGSGSSGLETAENAFLYTILEAGVNTEGGGIAWAVGPFMEGDEKGIWEDGVDETFTKMYEYLKPVETAVKNTRPSQSYPTPAYSTYASINWGVATESPDGDKTYLHIIKDSAAAIDGKTLTLPAPADGKLFASASLLTTGETVELVQTDAAVTLTLPDSADWEDLDTVIVLESLGYGPVKTVDPYSIGASVLGATSSDYQSAGFTLPSLIDGRSGNNNGWHTASGTTDAYVTIDLGGVYDLTGMTLYPRDGEDGKYAERFVKGLDVYVSNTAPAYADGEISDLPAENLVLSTEAPFTSASSSAYVALPEIIAGRYVTLHVKSVQGGDCLNLSEVRLSLVQDNENAPGLPENLTAQSGDGTVRLAWNAPANTGSSPITGYQVRVNGGAWIRVAEPAYTAGDLINGQTYTFEVRALNKGNVGPAVSITAVPWPVPTYTITVTQTAGGMISPNSVSVEEGQDQTFTIRAEEGYQIQDVLVDGESVGAVETYTFPAVTEPHTLTAQFRPVEIDVPDRPHQKPDKPEHPASHVDFVDVKSSDWYAEAVEYVAENGIMTGVAEGVFNPDGSVTRAMVWTVLARMDGVNTEDGSSWYAEVQRWAMETGISDGTDPMDSITREQLAAMLYRFAGSPAVTGDLSAYSDAASVSDWAEDAIVWATETGLINGMGGNLSPKTGATRAQLATMLMRFEEAQ